MKWDIYKAKSWMLRVGMDHIKDGLFAEGGEMLYEAKWGDGCDTEYRFRRSLQSITHWEDEDIDDAVQEIIK